MRGIYLAPFNELAEPARVVEVAVAAEARGWDGFFVWDHIAYDPPVVEVADPWVVLAAVAGATRRMLIGPLVTPPSRRRWQKLAREGETLQRLSAGRLIFGAGLGGTRPQEFSDFGEEMDLRARARILDESLAKLREQWGTGIPIWIAGRWPMRRPLRRAARWDGFFPIDLPGPEALAEFAAELRDLRGAGAGPFELVVTNPPGTDPGPWREAGATWCLTGFGPNPSFDEVTATIEAGP
jgi:alkanesulfonate monooxygenase SsuD/methylene tetrahydromethanopterin reductase-like flavin-dependent oxidoreductase (luciferase family)